MKKLMMTSALVAGLATGALAEDVKIGVALGYTGPIESLTPAMSAGAEAAMAEVNASGKFALGTIVPVRGDTTCTDAAAATAMFERLVDSDGVKAIVGGDCSGVTGAMLQNVARPKGVVMVSPSATAPNLSTDEDDGLFFRTAPSDARQGEIAAAIMKDRGYSNIAITYTNNDYGKGLADSIQSAWEGMGGTVSLSASHEDGKADYSSEIAALDSAGGDVLVVAGYLDQGGKGMIQAALDTGAFDTFELPDGMIGDSLTENFGEQIDGSFGQIGGSDSPNAATFAEQMAAIDVDANGPYVGTSYDAAALIMLAMAAAGSTESADFKGKVEEIANAPGEPIGPGELGRALELIAAGTDIDYVGATDIELINSGETAGKFREVEIQAGKFETIGYR